MLVLFVATPWACGPVFAGTLAAWGDNSLGQTNVPVGNNFITIAGGTYHSLAIKSDASLVGWGYDAYGQVSNTPADNNFIAIAGGDYHSLALKSDNSLVAWGFDADGQVSNTPADNNFVAVAAGGRHSLALKSDGSLAAWGMDAYGQVSNTPADNNFVAVAGGVWHSLALKSDGSLAAWGLDNYGQVSSTPAGNNFVAVVGGNYHNLALKSDGSLAAWGRNDHGQVSNTPADNNFVAITAGWNYNLALKSDGTLVAWGNNSFGQVTDVPDGNGFLAVAAGGYHSLVLAEPALTLIDPNGGESLRAGSNYPIRWKSKGAVSEVLVEYSADNGSNWTAVAPANSGNKGFYHWDVPTLQSQQYLVRISNASDATVFDASDAVFTIYGPGYPGYLVGWGRNTYGQCDVLAGGDYLAITSGWGHSVALKSDGSIVAWGSDFSGEVSGVPAGNDFIAVAGGSSHNLALKSDGSLAAWGRDDYGQVSNLPADSNYVAAAAGSFHNLALKSDGALTAWGRDAYGEVSNTPVGNDFVAIAAGGSHNLALKSDGSIVAWGSDLSSEVSDVSAGNNFVAIAAGGSHNLALTSDGTLAAWGWDDYGQVSDIPDGNDFIAIAAGGSHSLALKNDGSIVWWGDNRYGKSCVPRGNNFLAVAAGSDHSLAIVSETDTSSLTLISPNGGESLLADNTYTIDWTNTGFISAVRIEYSADNGSNWMVISPGSVICNAGSYDWQVPRGFSEQCLIRVSDYDEPNIVDSSDGLFTIFKCLGPIAGDLNGDCYVNMYDFTIIASQWLDCANPFDVACGVGLPPPLLWHEDFEIGDFTKYNWQHGGSADWTVVSDVVYDGSYSAKSGPIADDQYSSLIITVDVEFDFPPAQVSFYRKVSSESWDYLIFGIDSVGLADWSGEQDWALETFTVTPGQHTLIWQYTKDGSMSSGSDCAWIDDIRLELVE
jgi:alpha-tubulin suppressor-like RCC1 family protein